MPLTVAGVVHFQRHGALAVATLCQDGKFNAMSRAMWRDLRDGFVSIAADNELRCVLVRGAGGSFCAGGDIAEYPEFRFDQQRLRDFHESEVWGALQAMLDCDQVLIAQIEGNCIGAGLEIASCCDLRIAAESSKFGAPITRLGFPMAPRELQLVMRQVGGATAREMLLEAAMLDAPRLLQAGFLNRIADDKNLDGVVQASARRVCALAPGAARMNKRAMRALSSAGSAEDGGHGLAAMLGSAYDYADSAEHREGIAAFLDKRKPVF